MIIWRIAELADVDRKERDLNCELLGVLLSAVPLEALSFVVARQCERRSAHLFCADPARAFTFITISVYTMLPVIVS